MQLGTTLWVTGVRSALFKRQQPVNEQTRQNSSQSKASPVISKLPGKTCTTITADGKSVNTTVDGHNECTSPLTEVSIIDTRPGKTHSFVSLSVVQTVPVRVYRR